MIPQTPSHGFDIRLSEQQNGSYSLGHSVNDPEHSQADKICGPVPDMDDCVSPADFRLKIEYANKINKTKFENRRKG